MAVLRKTNGMLFQAQDAYIKVAGGVKLDEPAIDLAVLVALFQVTEMLLLDYQIVLLGKLGLQVKYVVFRELNNVYQKLRNLDLNVRLFLSSNIGGWDYPKGIRVVGVETVSDALKIAFSN